MCGDDHENICVASVNVRKLGTWQVSHIKMVFAQDSKIEGLNIEVIVDVVYQAEETLKSGVDNRQAS